MANYEDFSPTGAGFIDVEDDGQWFGGKSYTVTFIKEYRRKTNFDSQFDDVYYLEETCRDLAPVNLYDNMRLGQSPLEQYGVFRPLRSSGYTVNSGDGGLAYSPLKMTGYTYPDPREESLNDISWLVAPGITCTSSSYSISELEGDDQLNNVHKKKGVTATFSIASSVAAGIYHMAVKTWRGRAAVTIAGPFPGHIEEIHDGPTWTETNEERISISIGAVNISYPRPRTGINREDVVWDPFADPDDPGLPDNPTNPVPGDPGYPGGGAWVTLPNLTTTGGGRYGRQLVVVGHKRIYVGDL